MSVLVKETVTGLRHGHKSVGTTAVQLTVAVLPFPPNKGVLMRCPGSGDPTPNTAPIWVGNKEVTADSVETTGGMPIAPGEAMFIPIDDPTKLYCVSTAVSQDIAWVAI